MEGSPAVRMELLGTRSDLRAFVVVDTLVRGRAMGGVRLTPTVSEGEVASLAHKMTLKLALAGVEVGGAKAGIVGDLPRGPRRDRILAAFGRLAGPVLRGGVYLGTDQGVGYSDRRLIFRAAGYDVSTSGATRLPCSWSALWARCEEVTGHGVCEAILAHARRAGRRLEGADVVVQGFGIVGRGVARRLGAAGCRVVAVADLQGTLFAPQGLPVPELAAVTDSAGMVDRSRLPPTVRPLDGDKAWLDVDADVLVLAANSHAVGQTDAAEIHAPLVVEAANEPCTAAALAALEAAGVTVLPDIVCNPGAAIVTGLALTGAYPSVGDADDLVAWLFDEVGARVRRAAAAVDERVRAYGESPHEAAAAVARRQLDVWQASEQDDLRLFAGGRSRTEGGDVTEKHETVRERRDKYEEHLTPYLDHAPIGKPWVRLSDPLPEALPPEQFVEELANDVMGSAAANVGPFYERLIAQEIPLEGIQDWVKQWYFDARTFPSVIAQIAANATYFYDARQFMGANLAEELGEFDFAREHPTLVRTLGRALGVSDEELEFAEPFPETLVYTEYRQHLVRDYDWLEGLAAGSFAIELTIPGRFRQIARALSEQFGLDDEALEVFRIHAGDERLELDYGGDDKHAEEAAKLVAKYAVTAELQERVRLAVWRSIQARRVYQWGLYREIVLRRDPSWQEMLAPVAA